MKRLLIIAWLLTSGVLAQTNIPIYVHIVSHNEDAVAYEINSNAYAIERSQVINFANMVRTNGAVYCWQSDWRFLSALTNWDRGTPSTFGTNLAAWLRMTGHEVDPHSHETTRNYADVAELIRRLGIEPSPVVGGAVIAPLSNSIFNHVSSTITGNYFATTWTPQILWGGGTAGHSDDTNYMVSGVRRVRDAAHYLEHSPTGAIIAVGTYGNRDNRWTNLDQLISFRAQGKLCPDRMYTCLIMNNQTELNAAYIAAFDTKLKTYTNVPNLVWTSITNIVHVWQTQYGGQPNALPYEFDDDIDGDGLDDGWEVTNHCDITWTDGSGDLDSDGMSDLAEFITATQPTNAANYFRAESITVPGTTNTSLVGFIGAASRFYTLQSSTNLQTWLAEPAATNIPGSGTTLLLGDPPTTSAQKFYRLLANP